MIVEDMMHSFYRLSNVFWYCPLGDLIQEACSASVLPNAYHFLKALQERVYQTKISSQPGWIFNLSHDWSGVGAIKSEDCQQCNQPVVLVYKHSSKQAADILNKTSVSHTDFCLKNNELFTFHSAVALAIVDFRGQSAFQNQFSKEIIVVDTS